MALTVRWTSRAAGELDRTVQYIHHQWGIKAENNFVAEVEDVVKLISRDPEIGRIENKEKGIRAFVITSQSTLFYRLKNEVIVILSVFDNRQNPHKKDFKF